jgi:hypothetical protein
LPLLRTQNYIFMTNAVFWDVTSCGFVIIDVSEEPGASFIRVTRIGELGTTLAVCVGSLLQLELFLVHRFLSP